MDVVLESFECGCEAVCLSFASQEFFLKNKAVAMKRPICPKTYEKEGEGVLGPIFITTISLCKVSFQANGW